MNGCSPLHRRLRLVDAPAVPARTVPECLLRLSELRTLRLDHNVLLRVPKSVAGLQGLHTLTLSSNKLKDLPNEIGDLLALQVRDSRQI